MARRKVLSVLLLIGLASVTVTVFQNCGSGGRLTFEESSLRAATSINTKLLGSCVGQTGTNPLTCDEHWAPTTSGQADFQSTCGSTKYFATPCPKSTELLGYCQTSDASGLIKKFYYTGYTGSAMTVADESAQAEQTCNGGRWIGPGP